jgi:hypothetical protein
MVNFTHCFGVSDPWRALRAPTTGLMPTVIAKPDYSDPYLILGMAFYLCAHASGVVDEATAGVTSGYFS